MSSFLSYYTCKEASLMLKEAVRAGSLSCSGRYLHRWIQFVKLQLCNYYLCIFFFFFLVGGTGSRGPVSQFFFLDPLFY